ncbi:MAG: glutaredoxin family protein [Actinomycetota bacterium]
MAPRVVVHSRRGCHLCDDALVVVASTCDDLGVEWAVVDVDEAFLAQYSDDVPVVTVDGVPISRWFVEEAALRRALA